MTQTAIQRPEGLKVTYRRMKFPFEDHGFPRYWHGGSPFRSFFWDQLSAAFEPGERFFIDSARALKSEIKDPALLEELQAFCQQEGHHTAQHLKFDEVNQQMGVDVEACRARYRTSLDRGRASFDAMGMLAATCGLEHFTAALAGYYAQNPVISDGVHENVAPLWTWHAAEELEHKATCFDIYRQLGGGEAKRRAMMITTWTMILMLSLINTFILLHRDRKLFTWDTLKGHWYLFGWGGFFTSLRRPFFQYLWPGFHPWKEDSSELVRIWEAENRQYIVHSA